MRLALRMARSGLCSRRQAEQIIQQGRVQCGGTTVRDVAFCPQDEDVIAVDGRVLPPPQVTRLFAYHKPRKMLTTTHDPQGRRCLFDAVESQRQRYGVARLISVGRLDYDSEGLIVLTNDGALARHLELPSQGFERQYVVQVVAPLSRKACAVLAAGATIEGFRYRPVTVRAVGREARVFIDDHGGGNGVWLCASVREGKNREIRRLFDYVGHPVRRLLRIAYGPFRLGQLKAGELVEIPQQRIPQFKEGVSWSNES
ncbi:MAG: rRNA pseudouridine synthase [Alphaproteobacteria bacterium GM202ARS2]|nr:rRNA pseudouridine synthase [Alphaproteobacteria bacterium GM202ARS2]